jgi:NAD+ kinase
MTASAGSRQPSAERPVTRVAVVTHGRPGQVGDGLARLVALARDAGVELVLGEEEAGRHGLAAHGDPADAELVVVLGGDGTMLRALRQFLGTGIPVIGG